MSPKDFFCERPWMDMIIHLDGNVYPCCGISKPAGNLNHESVMNIWNGEMYQSLRESFSRGVIPDICQEKMSNCTLVQRYRKEKKKIERKVTDERMGKTSLPQVSIVIVNRNGKMYLQKCVQSLLSLDYPRNKLEIIIVDNCSRDGSNEFIKKNFPTVHLLENEENNYAKAVNRGLSETTGEYIALVNNDMEFDERWLKELVQVIELDDRIGAVGSKILLENGRINSVGLIHDENYYYSDEGFDEEDQGQYDHIRELEGIRGGSVLYRRVCLEDVGGIDEDFIMYFDDVDMSIRCRKKGWKLVYVPKSRVVHTYGGTSKNLRSKNEQYPYSLVYVLCNRNRLLLLAKHFPSELKKQLLRSHFYLNKQFDLLLEVIPDMLRKLVIHNSFTVVAKVLPGIVERLIAIYGIQKIDNVVSHLEILLKLRKIRIGIYDHAGHFLGGGQRVAWHIISQLYKQYDITYITNKKISRADITKWYGINFDQVSCRFKHIPLPFFEKEDNEQIDSTCIKEDMDNPFDTISNESLNYDIFINANMLTKVEPKSNISIFFCNFPDVTQRDHFHVHKYNYLIVNSRYTRSWLKKRWNLDADLLWYPPIEMCAPQKEKENIILSVARFEVGGTKKQAEMIKTFCELCETFSVIREQWSFILIGGSTSNNSYLQEIKFQVERVPFNNIKLRSNVSEEELRDVYSRAKIFWHACGLKQQNPAWREHFGMSVVEAMQNRCVPVVYNGGGLVEIVSHGKNGFLFNSLKELKKYTMKLVEHPYLINTMKEKSFLKSQHFSLAHFEKNVAKLFDKIKDDYENHKNSYIHNLLRNI